MDAHRFALQAVQILFFHSGDSGEPEHIHVEREQNVAKFWLDPVRLERSGGFGRAELVRMQHIVEEKKLVLNCENMCAFLQA